MQGALSQKSYATPSRVSILKASTFSCQIYEVEPSIRSIG